MVEVEFSNAESAIRQILAPKIKPLVNIYDSSAPYFEQEALHEEHLDEDNLNQELEDFISISEPLPAGSSILPPPLQQTSSLAPTLSNASRNSVPTTPQVKRRRLNQTPIQVETDELHVLKKENLVKTGLLLDLQIEAAKVDLELKEVSLELEKKKLRMFQ